MTSSSPLTVRQTTLTQPFSYQKPRTAGLRQRSKQVHTPPNPESFPQATLHVFPPSAAGHPLVGGHWWRE